ncbi:MAG: TIGR00645 family protein [Lysobacterales bacterium]
MSDPHRPGLNALSALIFSSRWLQLPLYLGLIVAQGIYVVQFVRELWHLLGTTFGFAHTPASDALVHSPETLIMLTVLGLIDVVMISNLLVMVIVGGYETFVSRLRLEGHPDQPEWLSHVNAAVLKVKLATAIIGISSIHLLKTFIEAGTLGQAGSKVTEEAVLWQTIIHLAFVVSALAIAGIDRIMSRTGPVHGMEQ